MELRPQSIIPSMKKVAAIAATATVAFFMPVTVNAEDTEYWHYEMQPGDHIWKIAHDFLTNWKSWQDVARINGIQNDRVMAAGTILKIPSSYVNKRFSSVRLIEVSGPVSLVSDGSTTAVPITAAATINLGSTLITGENASALLRFEDETEILLSPESEFSIQKADIVGNNRQIADINALLKRGEAEIRSNPNRTPGSRFVIETPSAFATTRGTVYRVRAEETTTAAEVTQGKIDVANPAGKVKVKATFGTLTEKDKAPTPPVKLLEAPEVPELKVVRYLPARISWSELEGAKGYRNQISESQEFSSILLDNRTVPAKMNLPVTLNDGHYWLKVKGIDENGLQGLESLQPFQIDARPFPPVVQQPFTSSRLYTGPVTFKWTQPENVARFRFEIASDKAFKDIRLSEELSDTEITTALDEPGKFYWRVSSIDGNEKYGPVGHAVQITVRPVPATPEPEPPVSSENEITFAWPEEEGSAYYQLQLSNDKTFSHILEDVQVEASSASVNKPEAGDYYMRVRGFDQDKYAGGWSSTQKVEVPVDSYMPAYIWGVISLILLL